MTQNINKVEYYRGENLSLDGIETGKQFLEYLQKIEFAGVVGVKTEADAEKLLKGLKEAKAPCRP